MALAEAIHTAMQVCAQLVHLEKSCGSVQIRLGPSIQIIKYFSLSFVYFFKTFLILVEIDSCLAEQASPAGLLWSSKFDHACCE